MNILTVIDEVNAINIDLQNVEGLQDLKEEVTLSKDKTVTFTVAADLSVGGNEGYIFIRDYFFQCGTLCQNKTLRAEIYIDCCDTTQRFIIERQNVKYDIVKCRIEFEMVTSSTIEEGKDFLDNRYWWFEYLDEREDLDFIHYRATSTAAAYTKYKSFLFLDILNYQLEKAGFTLQSNLLNSDPYKNLCFTFNNAEFGGITSNRNARTNTRSVADLIKDVATLLNAQYIYTTDANGNNVLIFEHVTYFQDTNNYQVIPLDGFQFNDDLLIQYQEIEQSNCLSMEYVYQYAGVTELVIETQAIYSDIVDFTDNNDIRAEKCQKVMPFHAPLIEPTGVAAGLFQQLLPGDFRSDNDIVVTIWNGTGNKGAEAETHQPIWNSLTDQWNYPLYFDKDSADGLYQRFHYTDNPETTSCEFEVANSSITLIPNTTPFCEVKEIVIEKGLFILFQIQDSEGCDFYLRPNGVTFDYSNNTIVLENLSFV